MVVACGRILLVGVPSPPVGAGLGMELLLPELPELISTPPPGRPRLVSEAVARSASEVARWAEAAPEAAGAATHRRCGGRL